MIIIVILILILILLILITTTTTTTFYYYEYYKYYYEYYYTTSDMICSHYKFLPESPSQYMSTTKISTPFAAQVTPVHELGESSAFTCIPHPLKIS